VENSTSDQEVIDSAANPGEDLEILHTSEEDLSFPFDEKQNTAKEMKVILEEMHPLRHGHKDGLTEEEMECFYSLRNKRKHRSSSYARKGSLSILVLTMVLGTGIIGLLLLRGVNAQKALQATAMIEYENTVNDLKQQVETYKLEKISLQKQIQTLSEENVQIQIEVDSSKASQDTTPSVPSVSSDPIPSKSSGTSLNTQQEIKYYTVARGDTLWKISQKIYGNGKYFEQIMKFNKMNNPDDLFVGMQLKIPKL
jgi:LysM repeat protein